MTTQDTGEERNGLLPLVARLYYLDNLGQQEVADMVGVSRTSVSRLLARARERGVVRIEVSPYEPRNRNLESALVQRFDLRHAVVVKTLPGVSVAQIRRTVGYFAGPVVAEWLRPQSVVGLAGGRTLRELVQYLTPEAGLPAGITAVQLMGNVGASVSPVDAAELTHLMAQRSRGVFYPLSAPAFAPDPATRAAYMSHAHVQLVWQLFDAMELAMVGVGTLDDSVFIERGALEEGGLRRLRALGAVGEICGRFYDRDGRECQADHHERVLSITLDQLRRVPAVVGVTNGPGRAEAVRAALTGQLLKSLVTDEAGAQAIMAGA